jgi:hypothetical protein
MLALPTITPTFKNTRFKKYLKFFLEPNYEVEERKLYYMNAQAVLQVLFNPLDESSDRIGNGSISALQMSLQRWYQSHATR